MKFPRLVCLADNEPYRHFSGHSVVVQVSDFACLRERARDVRASGNTLFCAIVHLDRPLAKAEIPNGIEDIPLAVMAPSAGCYRDLADRIPELHALNLRVYLSAGDPGSLVDLRILSSLGIHVGTIITGQNTDWEALADLAAYALLGRVPHAAIEPFALIASECVGGGMVNWGRAIFDDADYFLHLDAHGRAALSEHDLAEGKFIADDVGAIKSAKEYLHLRRRWHVQRRDDHPCAACPGWRICLGRYAGGPAAEGKCASFFEELLELASHRQAMRATALPLERAIWKP